MKDLLYVIAGLIIIIWGLILYGFNPNGSVHVLLVVAIIIILLRVFFPKHLSTK
jgi:hypothetical protein